MYWGGRRLQRGFASILNTIKIRNMKEAPERICIIFGQELDNEYVLGWKEAPVRIYINFSISIE